MESIPTPQNIKYNKKNDHSGEITVEPLYPGYGITVGNMLRRVLLSSIESAAIFSVKIEGVEHEFSTMPYVKEDVVDIILNIKQIKLKLEPGAEASFNEPLVLKVDKKGEGKFTAGDIDCPSQVKIVNPDLVIATLTDQAAKFEAEFTVAKGRGYLPVENFKGEKFSIGHIAVDAVFTPINRVSVNVENVRVGEMTNWDKLILEIETDGSIDPEFAFDSAVGIMIRQLETIKARGEFDDGSETSEDKNNATSESSIIEDTAIISKNNDEKTSPEVEKTDSNDADKKNDEPAPKPKKRGRPKKQD